MIKIKDGIDLLDLLRRSGFTAYELRKQRIIGEARIQKLKKRELRTRKELDFICENTVYQVGELIEYIESRKEDD